MADDGYSGWYARKLWGMLPAIYRALRSPAGAPLKFMAAEFYAIIWKTIPKTTRDFCFSALHRKPPTRLTNFRSCFKRPTSLERFSTHSDPLRAAESI